MKGVIIRIASVAVLTMVLMLASRKENHPASFCFTAESAPGVVFKALRTEEFLLVFVTDQKTIVGAYALESEEEIKKDPSIKLVECPKVSK